VSKQAMLANTPARYAQRHLCPVLLTTMHDTCKILRHTPKYNIVKCTVFETL